MIDPLPNVRIAELTKVADETTAKARQLAAGNELATAALARLDDLPTSLAAVIVGETKKGKSSVVNGLLGRPGMSPVAVDVATATYVMFEHGPDEARVRTGDGTARRIELSELADWTSVEGLSRNPDAADADGRIPGYPVSAKLEVDLLRHVALIDTPGVGGLIGEHTASTMAAIDTAGAMIFVTDLTVPLTEHEAAFLQRATESANVADVVIVANMADKLPPDEAAAAVDDARRRIAAQLPAFADAPIIAVSARRAEMAAIGSQGESARALLRERSGIDDLVRLIEERFVARSQVITQGIRLRVAQQALGIVASAAQARIEVLSSAAPATNIVELDDRLNRLRHDAETARVAFQAEIGALRRTLLGRIETAFLELTNELDHLAMDGVDHEQIEPIFSARIAALTDELTTVTVSGTGAATHKQFEVLMADESAAESLDSALSSAVAQAGSAVALRQGRDYQEQPMSADAAFMAVMGVTSGMSLTNMVLGGSAAQFLGLSLGAAVLGPVSLVLGAATLTLGLRRAKRNVRVTETRSWVRDISATARKDLTDATVARLDDAGLIIQTALRNFLHYENEQFREAQRLSRSTNPTNELAAARSTLDQASRLASTVGKAIDAIKLRQLSPPPA